jgi:DNA gyrase subunit A
VKASTTDTIYFVSKLGKAAAVAAHLIPETKKLSQGSAYFKVSPLSENDGLAAVFALPNNKSSLGEEVCVVTMTRFGMVKKSLISELPGPSSQTFTLVRVNEGDRLGWVGITDGKKKEILLATASGMAIRFKEDDVRPMGLVAAGVNAIKLDDKDEAVGMEILPTDGDLFFLTSDGKAKRVDVKEFLIQGRYGKGVVAWDLPNKVTLFGLVSGKANHVATIHLSKGAPKSARLDEAGLRKRTASKGDLVVEVKDGALITGINVGWELDKFIKVEKAEEKPAKAKAPTSKTKSKPVTKKKTAAKPKVLAKKSKSAPKKASRLVKKSLAKKKR